MTRSLHPLAAVAVLSVLAGCGSAFPTGSEIEEEPEQPLLSVSGLWVGSGVGNEARLVFRLVQTGTAVEGQGSLRQFQSGGSGSSDITLEGSYMRPRLELTISEFDWDGGSGVSGALSGDYSTVAGVPSTFGLSTGDSIQIMLRQLTFDSR